MQAFRTMTQEKLPNEAGVKFCPNQKTASCLALEALEAAITELLMSEL